MNVGERDELLFKLYLTYLRDNGGQVFGQAIRTVGFKGTQFGPFPSQYNPSSLKSMTDKQLTGLATSVGISKAPGKAKADVEINGAGVSLKSSKAAPSALVNHTTRPGFEFACNHVGISINTLDQIIDNYWQKRLSGIIGEDTRISDQQCPFANHFIYLQPLLEYFLFDGTGGGLSEKPADYLIVFSDPLDECTYKKLTKAEAVNALWTGLTFSVRSKGMPNNYNASTYNKPNAASIKRWVRYLNGDYKGALHIRSG